MKGKIDSPFTKGAGPMPSHKGEAGGTFNHNPVPAFSKPRDGGADLPLQFQTDITGTPAPINSPFKGMKK